MRRLKITKGKNSEEVKKKIWISDISVWSYGPLTSINFSSLNPGLVLIYGPNEAGKTLLLESILKSILFLSSDFKKNDRIDDNPNSKIIINKAYGDDLESFAFPEKRDKFSEIMEIELNNQSLDRLFRNTFIIRNSDLKIPEEKGYFSTVSNIVMGWDYKDLESVEVEIRNLGRLTKTNRGTNKIKKLRKDAVDLRSDIMLYLKEYKETEYESYEIKILEAKKEIKVNKSRLEILRNIEGKSKYEKSKRYLDKFVKVSHDLEPLKEFNTDSLNKLKLINNSIEDFKTRLNERGNRSSDNIIELEKTIKEQEEIKEDLVELEEKKTNFEILSKNIENWGVFSEKIGDVQNREQYIKFSYIFAILSLITLPGSIISLIMELIVLGFSFMIFGIIFGFMIFYDLRKFFRYSTLYRRILTIINITIKVGIKLFSNETYEENIQTLINSVSVPTLKYWLEKVEIKTKQFHELLDNLKLNLNSCNSKINVFQGQINQNRIKEEEYQRKLNSNQEEKHNFLTRLKVNDNNAFNIKVEKRKDFEGKKEKYRSHLQDFFGNDTKTIENWQLKLTDKYEKYRDLEVDIVDNYSEIHKEQEEIHRKIEDELPERIEKWNKTLSQHKSKLDSFAGRQNEVKLVDFKVLEENLEIKTIYQLGALNQKINDLIVLIDNDKDLALLALEIFEEIEKEETERIIKLFKNANISNLFKKITNGRYIDVKFTDDYEKNKNYVLVKKPDGQSLLSNLLSLGTNDQLLFSIRFALAEKLLNGNLGFFLFDDAFITSDPQRLKNQFEILKSFADKGWQIIYFSNKYEILKLFETNQIKSIYKLSQLE